MSNRLFAALLVLLAAGCSRPEPVSPPLWHVTGPKGEQAWLFGTIHALPDPVDWRSAKVDAALAAADSIVLEVAAVDDDAGLAQTFAKLATSPGHPPLSQRIDPDARAALLALLKASGKRDGDFAQMETWAAAFTLAQFIQQSTGSDPANGIDRALGRAAGGKPVREFEGAATQLAIFDALPEAEQADLLEHIVRDGDLSKADERKLERAWASGDIATIERGMAEGMLADPELREAVLTGRNRAWTAKLMQALAAGEKPFAAVGAAHLVGADGLPAMLVAQGYRVVRVQ